MRGGVALHSAFLYAQKPSTFSGIVKIMRDSNNDPQRRKNARDSVPSEVIEERFSGREEIVAEFMDHLNTSSRSVKVYFGIGGAGKTWLSLYLQAQCEAEGYPCARINFRKGYTPSNVGSALREIRVALGEAAPGMFFHRFDILWGQWWQKTHDGRPIQENQNLLPEEAEELAELLEFAYDVPIFGPAAKLISKWGKRAHKAWVDRDAVDWLKGEFGPKWKEHLRAFAPIDYEGVLPSALAADINQCVANLDNPPILFIDTYEALNEDEHPFIQTFAQWLASTSTRIHLVIFSRNRLRWAEKPYPSAAPGEESQWSLDTGSYWAHEVKRNDPNCYLSARLEQRLLGFFSENDTYEYLQRKHGITDPALCASLYALTRGYPLALSLALEIARNEADPTHGFDTITRALEQFTNDQDRRAELSRRLLAHITEHLEARGRHSLLGILRAISTMRWFTKELLRAVMGNPQGTFQDDFEHLLNYEFIEPCVIANKKRAYRLQDTVQEILYANIDSDLDRQEWHTKARNYFRKEIETLEQKRDAETPYLRWYGLENPLRQLNVTEWLYHLFRAENPRHARIEFASEFFKAFYWWGWYLKYPYCDELLNCFSALNLDEEALVFARHLKEFYRLYPIGPDEQKRAVSPDTWNSVREHLIDIRSLCGLDHPDENSETQTLIRALTANYLGDAYRFLRQLEPAEQWYQEAYQHTADENDKGWMRYFLSGLYLDQREWDKARAACQDALELTTRELRCKKRLKLPCRLSEIPGAYSDLNYELLANIYRVRGDADMQEVKRDSAFENYRQSVFFSYAFHGCPKAPDPYTQAIYAEMTLRYVDRLLSVWFSGERQKAVERASALQDYWIRLGALKTQHSSELLESMFQQANREELQSALFPRNVMEEDIGSNEYQRAVEHVVRSHAKEILLS